MPGMVSSFCLLMISCGVTVTSIIKEFQHSIGENINFPHYLLKMQQNTLDLSCNKTRQAPPCQG